MGDNKEGLALFGFIENLEDWKCFVKEKYGRQNLKSINAAVTDAHKKNSYKQEGGNIEEGGIIEIDINVGMQGKGKNKDCTNHHLRISLGMGKKQYNAGRVNKFIDLPCESDKVIWRIGHIGNYADYCDFVKRVYGDELQIQALTDDSLNAQLREQLDRNYADKQYKLFPGL